jgi:hypothetical protein
MINLVHNLLLGKDFFFFNKEKMKRSFLFSEPQLSFDSSIKELVNQALQTVVKRIYSETDRLNRLDAISGDGDTGTAFARAAEAIARDLSNGKLALDRPSSLFRRLGLIAESRMGGTCGASKKKRFIFCSLNFKQSFIFFC